MYLVKKQQVTFLYGQPQDVPYSGETGGHINHYTIY